MTQPTYSPRRKLAIWATLIAVSWFALIGAAFSAVTILNAIGDAL